jgi:hypothetical protein
MPALFGDHSGGKHPRELDGQQDFHRPVDVAELMPDATDDEAVAEDGVTGDLHREVWTGRNRDLITGGENRDASECWLSDAAPR